MKHKRDLTLTQKDPVDNVLKFIQRVIGDKADINDFIIKFDQTLNSDDLDTFQVNK